MQLRAADVKIRVTHGGRIMQASPSIDYLTVRFANQTDPDAIIIDKLQLDPNLFEDREFSPLPNYRKSKWFGGIVVCYDAAGARGAAAADWTDIEKQMSINRMGVCASMSGEGCRTFEHMSTLRFSSAGAMAELFQTIYLDSDASATRIDLALDDHNGHLEMNTLIEYAKHSANLNSRIRTIEVVSKYEGNLDRGQTLYIGHPSSNFRIRIYDKAKEQFTPEQAEYSKPWIRVELVMRAENANGFIAAYCNSADLGALAAGILNDKLRFIERDDSNISRCSTAQWWLDFVESVEQVKLFVPEPIQHTIDRMGEWLTYQVSPALATYFKAFGWTGITKLLTNGSTRMSDKHNAVLKDFQQRNTIGRRCAGAGVK